MSLGCFEAAVISLRDWPGIVACFGGNPAVHPEFPDLCRILAKHIKPAQRGLWCNNLFKHGPIAAETFSEGVLNLNAHGIPEAAQAMNRWFPGRVIPGSGAHHAFHSTILADYRDLGVSEEEWLKSREACDINQKWSAAIVEREGAPYAYFCEVAAAMDGVRGRNHGVPASPGWWQMPIQAPGYQQQIQKCCDQGCGVPLKLKGHRDNEQIYDITGSWAHTLPKASGAITEIVHFETPEKIGEVTDYMKVRSNKERD